MEDLAGKLCFLDTSFIMRAIIDESADASDLLHKMMMGESTLYINAVVLSELLHALERLYFRQFCAEEGADVGDYKEFKLWRKEQKKYYSSVTSEYQTIIDVLSNNHDIRLLSVPTFEGEIDLLLTMKRKFSVLDANDCLHYLSVLKSTDSIDYIVSSDSDFKIIDADRENAVQCCHIY